MTKLSQFEMLSFDCYGTLIDWESGIIEGLKPLTQKSTLPLSRDTILEAHAFYESTQQKWIPSSCYRDILAIVYKRLAEAWDVPVTRAECQAYGKSVENWPAFADSAEGLRYLKQHFKLAILSNVDNQSFAHSNAKLDVTFDAVFSAEDIGSYKPALRNFNYMLDHLGRRGINKADILHTAESMFHDHLPATEFGLARCLIHRRHDQEGFGATMKPGHLPVTDFEFTSLAALVKAHKSEIAEEQ